MTQQRNESEGEFPIQEPVVEIILPLETGEFVAMPDQSPNGENGHHEDTLVTKAAVSTARADLSRLYQFEPSLRSVDSYDTNVEGLRLQTQETIKAGNLRMRAATPDDIEQLVDLDMLSFKEVYRHYPASYDEQRADILQKFTNRFELTGYSWTEVLEGDDGTVVGFVMGCPTTIEPEEFESWEQITDNGTLNSTYNKDGKNLYVVSLTVAPGLMATGAHNMLYMDIMGKCYERGMDKGFFESRLPGLKTWLTRTTKAEGKTIDELSEEEKLAYAEEYLNTKRLTSKGKEVPLDPLIRSFDAIGADFVKVVPDGYQDEESLNFGVITVIGNVFPTWMRDKGPTKLLAGKTLRKIAKNNKLTNKLI